MAELDFENNLFNYVRRIEQQIELGKFVATDSEDFFLRIFTVVYDFKELQNLNYLKTNIKAIDLIDYTEKLGIQITAQKSKENEKIDGAIKGTIEEWKEKGVEKLWVFFISETDRIKKIDTSKEYCNIDGISVWVKTVKKLIGDINRQPIENRFRIAELIKQETSFEFTGLSRIALFSEIEKGKKITRNKFFNLDDTIYYSKKEYQTIQTLAEKYSGGRLKEYCILGNPCSGKTTFAYSIIQNTNKNRTFYLDCSNPDLQIHQLIDEIVQISHFQSLVVIDNIHENIELFFRLRDTIKKHKWIKALYLSRYYKTFDEFNEDNIYRILDGIPIFRIDTNENFDEKVSGIIWKKTKLLKERDSSLSWRKGNFKQVLQNINHNLLKLNIALRLWELKNKANSPLTFDSIDSNKILEQFYSEHGLHEYNSDSLLTYCLLFKNDISFIPIRMSFRENEVLREKGIILQYFNSDFCFFPHKEYAQLIFDSIEYMNNGFSLENKTQLLLNYFHVFDTKENQIDLLYIIPRLFYSVDCKVVSYLLADEFIVKQIQLELKEKNTTIKKVSTFLNVLFKISEEIPIPSLHLYLNTILSFFNLNRLQLFVYEDYMIYTRLLQLGDSVNVKIEKELISKTLRKNEVASTDSIVELTLRISRKNRTPETVLRILNSFIFPEWLSMISGLPKLTNISNSLSELNKSTDAKRLLAGLMRNIDWDSQFKSSQTLKIDQFAKAIREIQKIDTSVSTRVSYELFDKGIKENYISQKLEVSNLSEYSKALSDFSKISPKFVCHQLATDLNSNKLERLFSKEESISNFTARALELKKHIEDKDKYFSVLNSIVNSDSFISKIESENNLNYLLIFGEFASNFLEFDNSKIEEIITKKITNVVKTLPDKFEALTNPKFLNVESLDSSFIESITARDIEKFFSGNKITYAEDLFRVLSTIDKSKTILLFKSVQNRLIIQALLNPEVNFSQALEYLYKLNNKVYKNNNENCLDKVSVILDGYLSQYKLTERRYYKVSISDFIKGYYFGLCVNFTIIDKYCLNDLLAKFNSKNHKSFEISPLFQFVRRISDKTEHRLDKEIENFLNLNTSNFIGAIRNEEIVKTLSGLCELALSPFKVYADELLFKCKGVIIKKVKQRKREDIYKVKLIPDIEKIASRKGKVILKELS